MRQINNWENVQALTEKEKLPAGGYVVDIKNAEVKSYNGANGNFEILEVYIDIAEGDYEKFYTNDYKNQTNAEKKWRGVLRQYLPKDDGSEKDEWTKSSLKGLITAIEQSNNGYHWDWDETKLKGKKVGCLFRNEEWEYNGKTGFKTAPFKFLSVDRIKSGNFKVPKDKLLNKPIVPVETKPNVDVFISDDDLPF